MITIEISVAKRDLLLKILDTYLSELRHEIAATKRDTSSLHSEENLVNELKRKLSQTSVTPRIERCTRPPSAEPNDRNWSDLLHRLSVADRPRM